MVSILKVDIQTKTLGLYVYFQNRSSSVILWVWLICGNLVEFSKTSLL